MANGINSSEDYDSSSSCSNDDDDDGINDLYNELYDSFIKAKKKLKSANSKIEMLNEEIKMIRIENDMLSVWLKNNPLIIITIGGVKFWKMKLEI